MVEHPHDDLLDPENAERRAFTAQAILALLSGVTVTIGGCGGGGSSPSPTSPSPNQDAGITGSVSANHGHVARITDAQLMAGNAVALGIRGGATHPHTVELSMEEVERIAARARVSKASSRDDSPDAGVHSHTVTFN